MNKMQQKQTSTYKDTDYWITTDLYGNIKTLSFRDVRSC